MALIPWSYKVVVSAIIFNVRYIMQSYSRKFGLLNHISVLIYTGLNQGLLFQWNYSGVTPL